MSVRVSTWVWEHSEARLTDRIVLLAIADCASDDGTRAWPSVATVAQKCRISLRAAQSAIRRLIKEGHLLVEDQTGPRGTNRYTVVMTNICTPADSGLPVSAPPQEVVDTPADIGQTPADIGQVSPISAPVTVLEPSIEQPLEKPSDAREFNRRVSELAQRWCSMVPLSNLNQSKSVIAKAIGSGYTDLEIAAGFDALLNDHYGLTENTLRIAITDLRPRGRPSKADARANGHLALIEKFSQPQQPAIGT